LDQNSGRVRFIAFDIEHSCHGSLQDRLCLADDGATAAEEPVHKVQQTGCASSSNAAGPEARQGHCCNRPLGERAGSQFRVATLVWRTPRTMGRVPHAVCARAEPARHRTGMLAGCSGAIMDRVWRGVEQPVGRSGCLLDYPSRDVPGAPLGLQLGLNPNY
jgi:hypothetical protein